MKKTTTSTAESNDILLSIIKNISLGIIAFNRNGRITIVNEMARVNLCIPFSLNEMENMHILECIKDKNILTDLVKDCLNNGRKSFNIRNLEYRGKQMMITGNSILNGMIITITDVTEKKESEKAMLKALIKGQEDERKRIAKEIHDGLGPMLSAVKMHVQAVQSDLDTIDKNTLTKLETIYNLIDNVANDMRSLSHDLMPRIVEDFGLVEALGSISNSLANQTTKIVFTHNVDGERYAKNIELNLYRIAQELIHNAIKYSKAEKITLQLLKHTDSLILMVEDNGQGFAQKERKDFGIGLRNIETRVIAMGGIFTIDSVPDIGVTATVEIALPS